MAQEEPIKLELQNNLNEQLKKLNKVLDKTEQSVSKLSKRFEKDVNQATKETSENVKDTTEEVEKQNKSVGKLGKRYATLDDDVDEWVGSLKKANSTMSKVNDSTGKTNDSMERLKNNLGSFNFGALNVDALTLGFLSLPTSMSSFFGSAHSMNQWLWQLNDSMRALSDQMGSTGKAQGMLMKSFGESAGSLDTIKQSMMGLSAAGINLKDESLQPLTTMVTDVSLATGISQDAFAKFAGELRRKKVSVGGIKGAISNVLELGNTFGMTSQEIETSMQSIDSMMGKFSFEDGVKGVKDFTEGVSGLIGAMSKLGASAQRATSFVEDLMDPDKIHENMTAWNMMGVSYQEVNKMMATGDMNTVVDKMMTNLPQLAQRLKGIQDIAAKRNIIQSMGFNDPKMVQKFASGNLSEMRKALKDYKKNAADEKALAKKQKRMQQEAQKFDDQLHFIKMDMLMPMMKWLQGNYGKFMDFLKGIGNAVKKIQQNFIIPFLDYMEAQLKPAMDSLISGDYSQILPNLASAAGRVIGDIIDKALVDMIKYVGQNFDKILSGLRDFVSKLWVNFTDGLRESIGPVADLVKYAVPITLAIKALNKAAGFLSGLLGPLKNFFKKPEISLGEQRIHTQLKLINKNLIRRRRGSSSSSGGRNNYSKRGRRAKSGRTRGMWNKVKSNLSKLVPKKFRKVAQAGQKFTNITKATQAQKLAPVGRMGMGQALKMGVPTNAQAGKGFLGGAKTLGKGFAGGFKGGSMFHPAKGAKAAGSMLKLAKGGSMFSRLGSLGAAGGLATKALGPAGLAISSAIGGVKGYHNTGKNFNKEQGETTAGEKAASTAGGAVSGLMMGAIDEQRMAHAFKDFGDSVGKEFETVFSKDSSVGEKFGAMFRGFGKSVAMPITAGIEYATNAEKVHKKNMKHIQKQHEEKMKTIKENAKTHSNASKSIRAKLKKQAEELRKEGTHEANKKAKEIEKIERSYEQAKLKRTIEAAEKGEIKLTKVELKKKKERYDKLVEGSRTLEEKLKNATYEQMRSFNKLKTQSVKDLNFDDVARIMNVAMNNLALRMVQSAQEASGKIQESINNLSDMASGLDLSSFHGAMNRDLQDMVRRTETRFQDTSEILGSYSTKEYIKKLKSGQNKELAFSEAFADGSAGDIKDKLRLNELTYKRLLRDSNLDNEEKEIVKTLLTKTQAAQENFENMKQNAYNQARTMKEQMENIKKKMDVQNDVSKKNYGANAKTAQNTSDKSAKEQGADFLRMFKDNPTFFGVSVQT